MVPASFSTVPAFRPVRVALHLLALSQGRDFLEARRLLAAADPSPVPYGDPHR